MTKRLETPQVRLICFGGARDLTNSPTGQFNPEEIPVDLYD